MYIMGIQTRKDKENRMIGEKNYNKKKKNNWKRQKQKMIRYWMKERRYG